MPNYKTLDNIRLEALHEAFLEAFSDYQVKMDMPFWKFQQMLQRRGYHPEISIGAFEGERLVGFVLNGLRNWDGKATTYDLGTGVVAEFRRQGITSEMILHAKKILKEKQVEQYLLEVIKTNQSAFQLYQKQGFEIQRELSCFQLDKDTFMPRTTCEVECVEKIELEQLTAFWDSKPSWQNSIASIDAVPEIFTYFIVRFDNNIVGYGVIDKKTGDIPQIAVNKDHRGKGIASSIMTAMVKSSESHKISILNVEAIQKQFEEFLTKLGFTYYVGQYEMISTLSPIPQQSTTHD